MNLSPPPNFELVPTPWLPTNRACIPKCTVLSIVFTRPLPRMQSGCQRQTIACHTSHTNDKALV